jgi:RNA recognition motif-containing protein
MAVRLIVDGLPVPFSQKSLEELCADLIGLRSARLVTDRAGDGLGFAYIEIDEPSHVSQTIKTLEGRRFGSKPLVVKVIEHPAAVFHRERISCNGHIQTFIGVRHDPHGLQVRIPVHELLWAHPEHAQYHFELCVRQLTAAAARTASRLAALERLRSPAREYVLNRFIRGGQKSRLQPTERTAGTV